VALILRQFKTENSDYYSHLINELKLKLSRWQIEKKIEFSNYYELNQLLFEINEVLDGK